MKRLVALLGLAASVTSCGQLEGMEGGLFSALDRPVPPAQQVLNSQDPALVRHVLFFDVDGDREISFNECRKRLQELGLGGVSSAGIALVFNGFFGPKTNEGFAFTIRADEITKGLHRSDTGIFDKNGHMIQSRFDAVFARSDQNKDGALDDREIALMIERHKEETTGNRISKAEFEFLMRVGQDRTVNFQGRSLRALSRERLQSFYDGTLFYQLAAERKQR